MKLKPSRRQITVLLVAALVLVALVISRSRSTGGDTHGGLDDAANRACSDFAAGNPRARSTTSRLRLADKVVVSSGRTENTEIKKRAAELGRSADDSAATWKSASGALTTACRNAGWTAG